MQNLMIARAVLFAIIVGSCPNLFCSQDVYDYVPPVPKGFVGPCISLPIIASSYDSEIRKVFLGDCGKELDSSEVECLSKPPIVEEPYKPKVDRLLWALGLSYPNSRPDFVTACVFAGDGASKACWLGEIESQRNK